MFLDQLTKTFTPTNEQATEKHLREGQQQREEHCGLPQFNRHTLLGIIKHKVKNFIAPGHITNESNRTIQIVMDGSIVNLKHNSISNPTRDADAIALTPNLGEFVYIDGQKQTTRPNLALKIPDGARADVGRTSDNVVTISLKLPPLFKAELVLLKEEFLPRSR
jgi:hypothetical protein